MTILLVEESPGMREALEACLRGSGYRLISVGRPEEALSACRYYSGQIHLLLASAQMPHMSAVTMAKKAQLSRPRTPVLFMAGPGEDAALAGATNVIRKPFFMDALLLKVASLIGSPRPATPALRTTPQPSTPGPEIVRS